jgi:UDP-N-acetyl-D-glucosamine dehydrogenase
MSEVTVRDVRVAEHAPLDGEADVIDLRVRQSKELNGTVAIVGLGYVGLPTALGFVDAGARVIGIDHDPRRLERISLGEVDLLPEDHERLRAALSGESFECSADPWRIAEADTVIVCVPTPVDRRRLPDLAPLAGACEVVVSHARPGQLLILTSTTYVGCTRDMLVGPLSDRGFRVGEDILVTFSPERIDPGNGQFTQDVVPRVIGGATEACGARAAEVLGTVAADTHLVSTMEAAEMTKLVENTFRAVNIALANEFADVSSALGLDVTEIIQAAATKPYGFMPFRPGPGVGGHCIPCDPHYLLWQLREHRLTIPVIENAMAGIAARPDRVVARAAEILSDIGRGTADAKVLVVGVTYKPGVADVRESPALDIISGLERRGAEVSYFDPYVPEIRLHDGRRLASVAEPSSEGVDLVLLHTAHPDQDLSWISATTTVLDATYNTDKGWPVP